MKAWVSGQAAVAVLVEGETISSFELDSPNLLVPRQAGDLSHLFADATDVVELAETTREQVVAELELSWRKDRALHLLLLLLDGTAEAPTRRLAAECLEGFLAEPGVADFVSNPLYAAPLPPTADLPGARVQAEAVSGERVRAFLDELEKHQAAIRRCREAWDSFPPELVEGGDTKRAFELLAVSTGAFRRSAHAGGTGVPTEADLFQRLVEPGLDRLFQAASRDVDQRNLRPARQKLEKALRILEANGIRDSEGGGIYYLLALIDGREGNYSDAREKLKEALRRRQRRGGNPGGEGAVWDLLAQIDLMEKRYSKARQKSEKALAIWRAANIPGEMHYWFILAAADKGEGNYPAARLGYEKARDAARSAGSRRREADAWEALAQLAVEQGDDGEARRCYEQELHIRQSLEDRFAEAAALWSLNRLEFQQADYEAARQSSERLLVVMRALGDSVGEAYAWCNFCALARKNGRYAAAMLFLGVCHLLLSNTSDDEQHQSLRSTVEKAFSDWRASLGDERIEARLAQARQAYQKDQGRSLLRHAFLEEPDPEEEEFDKWIAETEGVDAKSFARELLGSGVCQPRRHGPGLTRRSSRPQSASREHLEAVEFAPHDCPPATHSGRTG